MDKILILIPTLNEMKSLPEILFHLCDYSVLIINDGSADGTKEYLKSIHWQANRFAITHEAREGIAKSYKDGFEFAIKNKYDFIITMDAGFSHRIQDMKKLLQVRNDNSIIIGSRAIEKSQIIGNNIFRKAISKIAALCWNSAVFNLFHRKKYIHDPTSGLRCYPMKFIENINYDKIFSKMQGIQLELLAQARLQKFELTEVPIIYEQTNSYFKFKHLNDGITAILNIFSHY